MDKIEKEANIKMLFPETTTEAFKRGVQFAQRWIPLSEERPPEDIEILGRSDKWIHPDYNTEGVRTCCTYDRIWVSAYWCEYHDEYHTRTSDEDDTTFKDSKGINQIPTHWRRITM